MERPQHYDELHRPHQHAERRKNRLHPDAQAQQRTPRRLPGEHVDDQGVFGADSGRRERHDRREGSASLVRGARSVTSPERGTLAGRSR